MSQDDLSNFSMEELFRAEAESQCEALVRDLLALEKAADPAPLLESLMRAAHSLKGAARIIGLDRAVQVAHVMEEGFVRAQKQNAPPDRAAIDTLLAGVDLLRQLAGVTDGHPTDKVIEDFVQACAQPAGKARALPRPAVKAAEEAPAPSPVQRRDVRLDSERLDNLLALAGQSVVASRPEDKELPALRAALRQVQAQLAEASRDAMRRDALLHQASAGLSRSQSLLVEASEARDVRARRLEQLCQRIHNETFACRLRPFGDITSGLHRLARDLARDLGREVRIEVAGEDTEVDRDLLDRLDGPLAHLIRNAVDHGLESPEERAAKGKPPEGRLQISARHHAGWLIITIADDGRGLDSEGIRKAVVRRGLAAPDHAAQMSEEELLDFLLLPGFSLREDVTEISGRGVGLDAVRAMAYGAGGSLRLSRRESGGFLCEIILPVSLSLVRSLIVEVGGDFLALPLTRVEQVLQVPAADIQTVAARQHIFLGDERLEILSAGQVLELGEEESSAAGVRPVVVLQGPQGRLGLTFDRFVGQRELSLQRLDANLGRVQDVNATALLDNGEPVIVLDVNDLAITAVNFSSGSRYRPLEAGEHAARRSSRRILVADDSLTVRELERKLLASRGYDVETAVDGADAWNALRSGDYDLLVTDIDMPRLDGIELVRLVRADARLRDLAVVVVSYKDREEDRARGLEAGADFYLPKSSYQDESLLKAVRELIGDSVAS